MSAANDQAAEAHPINEQWMAEQLSHFPPGSMNDAVRMLRAFERADRRTVGTAPSTTGRAA